MRFKDFLYEKKEEKYLGREGSAIVSALKSSRYNMSDALSQANKGNILYRGMHFRESFYFNHGYVKGDVTDFRTPSSIKGGNLHAMLDAFPSWRKINDAAPRHQAIICTSDKDEAASYDEPFVILPENGTQLIISPTADIHKGKWVGIDEYGERGGGLGASGAASGVGALLQAIFGAQGASVSKTSSNFIANLKKVTLPMIDAAIKNSADSQKTSTFKHFYNIMYVNDHAVTLFDALDELMSPENNGFSLQTLAQKLPANREIWFNGKFVAIKMQKKPTKELIDFCSALKLDIKWFIL